jgi:hypothetical protein
MGIKAVGTRVIYSPNATWNCLGRCAVPTTGLQVNVLRQGGWTVVLHQMWHLPSSRTQLKLSMVQSPQCPSQGGRIKGALWPFSGELQEGKSQSQGQ